MKTLDIDYNNIVTENEVFMTQVLAAFTGCQPLLRWEVVDGQLGFVVEFIPKAARQRITPENLPRLLQAQADVHAACPTGSAYWGPFLFCIREQGSLEPRRYIPDELQPLFQAAMVR